MGVYTENKIDKFGNITDAIVKKGENNILSWTKYYYDDPLRRLTMTCNVLFKYDNPDVQEEVCTHTEYYPSGKVKVETNEMGAKTGEKRGQVYFFILWVLSFATKHHAFFFFNEDKRK